jgi:uncharacterized metal-binding protein
MTRIGELRTKLAVTSDKSMLRRRQYSSRRVIFLEGCVTIGSEVEISLLRSKFKSCDIFIRY